MKREVVARPVDTLGAWGEGFWLVQIPSDPPRVLTAMVAPVGDKIEKWVARSWDGLCQVHFGGSAKTYQDAIYSIVSGYLDYAAGHWPRLAHNQDPTVDLEPATIVPLDPSIGETPVTGIRPPPREPTPALPTPRAPIVLTAPAPVPVAPSPGRGRRRGRAAGSR